MPFDDHKVTKVSRRALMQAGVGLAGGAILPAGLTLPAFAVDAKKPAIGLYVRSGAKLPDFADPKEWLFDGTAAADLLPPSVIEGVARLGCARHTSRGWRNPPPLGWRSCNWIP